LLLCTTSCHGCYSTCGVVVANDVVEVLLAVSRPPIVVLVVLIMLFVVVVVVVVIVIVPQLGCSRAPTCCAC